MGEAEKISSLQLLRINSVIYFYGGSADSQLSYQVARDIEEHWNAPQGLVYFKGVPFRVVFQIEGIYAPELSATVVHENTDPRCNFFRIETTAHGNISYVDGLGSNTGYFKLDNLKDHSTTSAHEYGHSLGLDHPRILDIRGQGAPGIMYPRGTLVDPQYQYDPAIPAGQTGGTLNPYTRRVFQSDIDQLHLHKLSFDSRGRAIVGGFSSLWHEAH